MGIKNLLWLVLQVSIIAITALLIYEEIILLYQLFQPQQQIDTKFYPELGIFGPAIYGFGKMAEFLSPVIRFVMIVISVVLGGVAIGFSVLTYFVLKRKIGGLIAYLILILLWMVVTVAEQDPISIVPITISFIIFVILVKKDEFLKEKN